MTLRGADWLANSVGAYTQPIITLDRFAPFRGLIPGRIVMAPFSLGFPGTVQAIDVLFGTVQAIDVLADTVLATDSLT